MPTDRREWGIMHPDGSVSTGPSYQNRYGLAAERDRLNRDCGCNFGAGGHTLVMRDCSPWHVVQAAVVPDESNAAYNPDRNLKLYAGKGIGSRIAMRDEIVTHGDKPQVTVRGEGEVTEQPEDTHAG